MTSSPLGLHRVCEPAPGDPPSGPGMLPQAAWRLDPDPRIHPDEVRVQVERLNLDAASFRQIREAHGSDPDAMRAAVLGTIASRGKMHNPVTGSGGMLTGVVAEVGPRSPLGLRAGMRIATLVSLSLTPLAITDGLARWDAQSEQIPCEGHAILFARSIAVPLPDDLPGPVALAVMDVCGAPALTERVVSAYCAGPAPAAAPRPAPAAAPRPVPTAPAGTAPAGTAPAGTAPAAGDRAAADLAPAEPGRAGPVVAILGAAGKSGSLSAAAARAAGAAAIIGVVPTDAEAATLHGTGLVDAIVLADARDPVALAGAVADAGGPADVTVVCVDVPNCEGGAILATAPGGTVIFFSMATSFSAAALGAEGLAADVTMLIGNGYVPGHAELALNLIRTSAPLRALFDGRVFHDRAGFSAASTGKPAQTGVSGRDAATGGDPRTFHEAGVAREAGRLAAVTRREGL